MVGSNIYENTALAANGGGLVIWGTAELTNCDIYENDAPGTFGGGLYVGGGATAELADCRLYENTAETGGGLYNNGKLTLQTSLLERNTGPDGAQLSLAGGSELIYILPVPLGHYLDGAVMCQKQMCKEDMNCQRDCDLEPCPTQCFVTPTFSVASTSKPIDPKQKTVKQSTNSSRWPAKLACRAAQVTCSTSRAPSVLAHVLLVSTARLERGSPFLAP